MSLTFLYTISLHFLLSQCKLIHIATPFHTHSLFMLWNPMDVESSHIILHHSKIANNLSLHVVQIVDTITITSPNHEYEFWAEGRSATTLSPYTMVGSVYTNMCSCMSQYYGKVLVFEYNSNHPSFPPWVPNINVEWPPKL